MLDDFDAPVKHHNRGILSKTLSKSWGKREYTTAYFPKRLCTGTERLVLSRRIPELSHEFDTRLYRFDSSVDDCWFAVKPRDVHRA